MIVEKIKNKGKEISVLEGTDRYFMQNKNWLWLT
tara:strand:+ start:412 stop:513 length:102 start_codon:yes stop_codon:yes gene_type:complete